MDDQIDGESFDIKTVSTEDIKDLAYQLWAYVCRRDASAVARRLDVNPRNVQRWAKTEDWTGRYRRDMASIMPDLVEQTAVNLSLAAFEASQRLHELARRSNENDGLTKEEQFEMKAMGVAVTLGGFSPIGQNRLASPAGSGQTAPDDEPLSLTERIARHHARIAGER